MEHIHLQELKNVIHLAQEHHSTDVSVEAIPGRLAGIFAEECWDLCVAHGGREVNSASGCASPD